MLFAAILSTFLINANSVSTESEESVVLETLVRDDACTGEASEGEACILALRQLRGERLTLNEEPEEDTCGKWTGECDIFMEVRLENSTVCDDGCSQDTCCESKASCDFFTMTGGCSHLEVPSNVTDMVWAKRKGDEFTEMFCESSAQNLDSCGKACCELQPCTKCAGQQYMTGCQAGSTGTCNACPTKSSCPTGNFQTCGDGTLSECKACSNAAPEHAHYTGSAMTSECPWKCDANYELQDGKCVLQNCGLWSSKGSACDAATQVALDAATMCGEQCSQSSCCQSKANCSTYTLTGACASVAEVAVEGKVWAPIVPADNSILYCKNEHSDAASCEKACCSQQSCKSCSGQTYTDGCVAGSIGSCAACPLKAACATGSFQTCGEGLLSKCQPCSNAPPENSHYTGTAMSSECPWKCNDNYEIEDGKCALKSCGLWSKRGGACDARTEVDLDSGTLCGDNCSQSSCCEAKATCSSFTSTGACALVKDVAAAGKVWAPMVSTTDSQLYCKGTASDAPSCEKACCAEQSCQSCTGQMYTDGCKPGSIGSCKACPTKASCVKGEFQTCGEGNLSECTPCKNAPAENSHYTGSAMGTSCPWKCNEGFIQTTENGADVCKASCSLYSCSAEKGLIAIPKAETVMQGESESSNDDVCCQSAGCPDMLSTKKALPQTFWCDRVAKEELCTASYVAYEEKDSNEPLFTECVWDANMNRCHEDCKSLRNCKA